MKTAEQFLEELQSELKMQIAPEEQEDGWRAGVNFICETILAKIKRFEAEQKQVSDENR